MTTLTYCLDGAAPKYASVANWFDCNGIGAADPNWLQHYEWGLGGNMINHMCDTGGPNAVFQQVTDPQTGKTVLGMIWNSEYPGQNTDPYSGWIRMNSGDGGWNNGNFVGTTTFTHSWPAGNYMELKVHSSPNVLTSWPFGGAPTPDFFTWGYNQTFHGCLSSGGTGPCALEQDLYETEITLETYHSAAYHAWNDGSSNWGWVYFGGGPNFEDEHTYGKLTTTDGNTGANGVVQICFYVDGVLNNTGGPVPCGQVVSSAPTSYVNDRQVLTWWLAGTYALDTAVCQANPTCVSFGGQPSYNVYIDHFAIWSCANWQTDPTCNVNGLQQ
jgi:hypothetical protein